MNLLTVWEVCACVFTLLLCSAAQRSCAHTHTHAQTHTHRAPDAHNLPARQATVIACQACQFAFCLYALDTKHIFTHEMKLLAISQTGLLGPRYQTTCLSHWLHSHAKFVDVGGREWFRALPFPKRGPPCLIWQGEQLGSPGYGCLALPLSTALCIAVQLNLRWLVTWEEV